MSSYTVTVLGGGIGGLVAANELRKHLPREHRVVVIEKNAQHAFAPSFLWLVTGERKPEQISRPMRKLVRPGVEVLQAEVREVDLAGRRVKTERGTLAYDYLVVALGAELAPETVPGLAEAAHTFYTFEGAARLREALAAFRGGVVAVVVSALPYKCPGAPHEGAMLLADYFKKRGLEDQAEVHLFTPEPQPLPVAGPQLGTAVAQMLEAKEVRFHPFHKLTAVNTQTRQLSFEGGKAVGCDLLVAIPPHRGPELARRAGLANEAGWIPVERTTLATRQENVYAVGDVTALSIPGRWRPDVPLALPKAGVFAHTQAKVVARRIAAEITGESTKDVFCGDGYCMLEAGEEMAGFAFGNFFAEPSPQIELRHLGRTWHRGKVLFEKWWLAPFGLRREILAGILTFGGKRLGIPINL